MLKSIKKMSIVAIATSMLAATSIASAKEIYILQAGSVNNHILPLIPEYEAKGYKVNHMKFNDCKASADWVRNNTDKEIVAFSWGGPFVGTVLEPNSPAACNHPLFNEKNFVGTVWKDSYFLCTRKNEPRSLEQMIKADNVKFGAGPLNKDHIFVANKLAQGFGAKWKTVILETGPAVRPALLAGDIDLMLTSDSTIITNEKCYLTTAVGENYTKIKNLYPGIPSIVDLPGQKNNPIAGASVYAFYLANNADVKDLTKIVRKITTENPDVVKFYKGKSLQNPMLVENYDPKAHYKEFNDYLIFIKNNK